MRIKGNPSKKKIRHNKVLWAVMGSVLALLALWGYATCQEDGEHYYCDMERTAENGTMYEGEGGFFFNGQTQSDDYAFSGRYSARCNAANVYGPSISIENVFSGDIIEASVMRKSDYGFGVLALQGDHGWQFNKEIGEAEKISNGWEQIKATLTVPAGVEGKALKVFCYYAAYSDGVVYFDDLKIKRIKNKNPFRLAPPSFDSERLDLEIAEKDIAKIRLKRAEAIATGVLLAGDADLVTARLQAKEGPLDVQARLKGDLPDHLMGTKWSFRIAVEGKNAWRGMNEFSVHNSLSRHHLDEWMYHQIMIQEDILTTRYDFIEMALNGRTMGVYAYEEHFNNGLLRHRERLPAPIIRWSEEGLWPNLKRAGQNRPPWFESAQIEPFGLKDVLKDKEQMAYFMSAQNLLYSFGQGAKKPSEVFETERLAKFLAITDLCVAYHALNATNLRFYFNPVTAKLEPVGYDGFTPEGTNEYPLPSMCGANINTRSPLRTTPIQNRFSFIDYYLFNDVDFAEKYAACLEAFTDPLYLDSLKVKALKEIEARVAFIRQEYTGYVFNWDYFFRNAMKIRNVLYPIPNISLKAYQGEGIITLESYHSLPLEVLGFGDNEINGRPSERLILESFNEYLPVRRYEVPFAGKAKFVFCKTLGTRATFKVPLFKWPAPTLGEPSTPDASIQELSNFDFLIVGTNNTISMRPGKHSLGTDLSVPPGYIFEIGPGTEVVLENGASIVSQSRIKFIGSTEQPILIHSGRGGGQGLLVLKADGRSVLSHVVFKNLDALQKHNQSTQSAVTFYEADVSLDHCAFLEIKSKNALSITHADYRLKDCQFDDVAGDAFDADYSTGNLDDMSFTNIGKDAIEVSGGNAAIGEAAIRQAFGAGINANHHAVVSAEKIEVTGSEQGIVATDLSKLVVNELKLDDLQQGILAYQKFPEFGGSQIEVKNCEPVNVRELHLVEDGSTLVLNGKSVGKH